MLSNTFKRIMTLSRPLTTRQVDNSDMMGKREKALEDMAVREHEKKLIDKLREEIKQKDQRLKNQEDQLKGNTNANASVESDDSGGDVDSKIRLLRKEVMGKIRDLEDEIQEIKYRLRM